MRSPCCWPSFWGLLLGLGWIAAAFSPTARSQSYLPATSSSTPTTAPVAPPAAQQLPPLSAEQLGEQIRALEVTNRKLAEQMELSNRDHDEQMRQLRESFEKLSKPSGDKKQDPGAQSDAGEPTAPRRRLRADDPLSPVPDYTEGLFAPLTPAPRV